MIKTSVVEKYIKKGEKHYENKNVKNTIKKL